MRSICLLCKTKKSCEDRVQKQSYFATLRCMLGNTPGKPSSLVFVKSLMVRLQFVEQNFEVAQCSFSMQIQ